MASTGKVRCSYFWRSLFLDFLIICNSASICVLDRPLKQPKESPAICIKSISKTVRERQDFRTMSEFSSSQWNMQRVLDYILLCWYHRHWWRCLVHLSVLFKVPDFNRPTVPLISLVLSKWTLTLWMKAIEGSLKQNTTDNHVILTFINEHMCPICVHAWCWS